MAKEFNYKFEVDKPNQITFEYSSEADEKLDVGFQGKTPILYLNRQGMITLAKMLVKMASSPHPEQFHVHLRKDFNADEPESVTIMLYPDDTH